MKSKFKLGQSLSSLACNFLTREKIDKQTSLFLFSKYIYLYIYKFIYISDANSFSHTYLLLCDTQFSFIINIYLLESTVIVSQKERRKNKEKKERGPLALSAYYAFSQILDCIKFSSGLSSFGEFFFVNLFSAHFHSNEFPSLVLNLFRVKFRCFCFAFGILDCTLIDNCLMKGPMFLDSIIV